MGLWFALGLTASILVFKPDMTSDIFTGFDTGTFNTVDTNRVRIPRRIPSAV